MLVRESRPLKLAFWPAEDVSPSLFFKQIIKKIKDEVLFIKPEMDGVWKILRYTKTL